MILASGVLAFIYQHFIAFSKRIRHYGLNGDVNGVLLMADIVLYGSSQDEQGFPSLVTRAMTFGVPVIAPDIPIIKKYVSPLSVFDFFSLQ